LPPGAAPAGRAPLPAAAQNLAGLPPLGRSIPLTAPTPPENSLPPQLVAAVSLAGAKVAPSPVPPVAATSSGTAPAALLPEAAPEASRTAQAVAPAVAPAGASIAAPRAASATEAGPSLRTVALRPGDNIQVTVLSIGEEAAPPPAASGLNSAAETPAAGPAAPRPAAPLAILTARLEGMTSRGQPVVTTQAGVLLLQARTELPVGTPLSLEAALPDRATAATPDLPAIDPLQGRTWPALKEILSVLTTIDPRLAHSVASHALPQPTSKLATTLIAFLGALRGGDAAGWLGEPAASALERAGRGDLMTRLTDDFRALAGQAQERLAGDWRAITVPFGQMGDIRAFQFAVRQPDPDEAGATADPARATRRFLIDVEFTRLGPMQLDGLTSIGRFDLVIRALSLLPTDLKRDLTAIFSGSLQAVGFTGQLAFQTGAQAWVRLTPARRRGRDTSG
jgi:hypothetical protein